MLTAFLSGPQRSVLHNRLDAGGSLLLKFGGHRDADYRTVVLDGGALGGEGWFRRGGDTLPEMLVAGVAALADALETAGSPRPA